MVVGGEGEEPSYSLKLISAALWSLLLCTQKCLDPMCIFALQEWLEFCRLQTYWIAWTNFLNEMRVSHGIASDMDVLGITYSSLAVWMLGFTCIRSPPAWCNTCKCINRARMDVCNRQRSHR